MSRIRVALGLGAVSMGTAWAIGGVAGLREVVAVLSVAVPVLLVLAGVVLMLRAAVPRGQLGGPLALMTVGIAVLALRFDMPHLPDLSRQAPVVLILGGVFVALFRGRSGTGIDTGVRCCTSLLYPHPKLKLEGRAPKKLVLRALLFGAVYVDLTDCEFPRSTRLVVDVTVLWARVELKLPADWTVLAGRVELTPGVQCFGDLSQPVFATPHPVRGETTTVVVNVQGLGGVVSLTRGA
ncbi:hypothetical protein HLK59_01035 [Streptomyces sp. S3(2020)]|uniref:hypothetical protein n=1 Tax=Streptomyces sp. S3(2020) TaxID=2732044 RepID=UPI001489844A|nr:hypothetical protein [Streptomyces sp. S3(2020)]NNN28958.1 hypothetical protein [Streptomyces sp. S3(2020)]